jgi:hypothetical protein
MDRSSTPGVLAEIRDAMVALLEETLIQGRTTTGLLGNMVVLSEEQQRKARQPRARISRPGHKPRSGAA